MKKKLILSSLLSIVVCLSLICGSTMALFTSESKVNVAVTSGKVEVVATVDGWQYTSLNNGGTWVDAKLTDEITFDNVGGKAIYDAATSSVNLEGIVPGDGVKLTVGITNNSTVTVKYKVSVVNTDNTDPALFDALEVKIDGETYTGKKESAWMVLTERGPIDAVDVEIVLPEDAEGKDLMGKTCAFNVIVNAVQGNAFIGDVWDGTIDTSWYDSANPQNEYTLQTAEQFAGLASLVDDGYNFTEMTIKLDQDLDLASLPFNPIGHSSNGKSFNGTFDGQGHTIFNMYEQSNLSAWQYEGEYYGLFAYTKGATIRNVTIADAYISSGRNEAAGVVGNAVDTQFSNITISNTTLIAYNNSAGGVAAECYGECSFTNITVDADTVIGPLWGTYDVRLGGVVGLVQAGNNVSFSNITVACQLDAINDVAANYQYWLYRYSGMLIGQVDGVNGVADPTGYVTCENVTVIYGDWVNYHYCENAALGAGSYNGPGQYKYERVEAGTGTDGIDLSACNHAEDESHNVLIVFDQLFGGGQGISGLKTYDGVTVVYPQP